MDSESTADLFDNGDHRVSYKNRKVGFPVFAVSCILLLAICIALGVLYSIAVNKHTVSHDRDGGEKHLRKYGICENKHCFNLGFDMVRKMNKSFDPCQDFYSYACGGWQQRIHLTNNKSEYSMASVVSGRNLYDIKKALERAHLIYGKNDAVMKTVQVYNSCMNTTFIDSYGIQPLKDLIKEYGGWSVSGNYDPNVTVQQRIGKLARDLNVDTLFRAEVRIDPYNTDETIIQLTKGHLAFLDIGKSLDSSTTLDFNDNEVRVAYFNYMKTVGRILGPNGRSESMQNIYLFEMEMMEVLGSQNQDGDAELRSHIQNNAVKDIRMSLSSFCKLSGFPLPFMQGILSTIFGVNIKETEKLIAKPMDSFKKLYKLYQKTNDSVMTDYLMWQVHKKYRYGLGDNYKYPEQYITGLPPLPRWKRCIELMFKPFDLTLGLLFVEDSFKDESKKKIEEMMYQIRSSFIENLPHHIWLDSKSRDEAKQKALAIRANIGYPAFIKNRVKLEEQYQSFTATDNFFENMKAFNYFMRTKEIKLYGKIVDKNEWIWTNPATFNAFFFRHFNEIVLLAGIIQRPMYKQENPRFVNYGGIGFIIGHEIMHGFDNNGRFYDKNASLRNWLSASADKSFREKATCFENQYNHYKVFDVPINGTKTLNDNIADNGGIKIAYNAWKKKSSETEKILPGLQLNPDQLFFLHFAQTWCSKYGKAAAMKRLQREVHAIQKYRVIGSLSNFDKFSEAFSCPTNSAMNPSAKCAIW